MAMSRRLNRCAVAGGRVVKVVNMGDWSEVCPQLNSPYSLVFTSCACQVKSDSITLDAEFGTIQQLEWTSDGQIISLSTSNGQVLNFLAVMPVLNDSYQNRYD